MPGTCPAGGAAAGGATGGGGARFEGTDIILVYSLGPGGGAAGGFTDGGQDRVTGPNMRVYSPDSCWGGGGAGGDPASGDGTTGNWDAEGNCGPAGIPPGDGLKNWVNSPPCGAGVPASGRWGPACREGA